VLKNKTAKAFALAELLCSRFSLINLQLGLNVPNDIFLSLCEALAQT
jgi:hypothetical protein